MCDPSQQYLQIVKDQLHQLNDSLLVEDIDLVCSYIVLRYLKTSPDVCGVATVDDVATGLLNFVQSIYPFLATFIMVVNSPALVVRGHA